MTPAAILFAVFHSFSSSWYVFSLSAVGTGVVEGWDVPEALGVPAVATVVVCCVVRGSTGSGSSAMDAFFHWMVLLMW